MSGKKADGQSGGVVGWISSACRFAADRNDFRRFVTVENDLRKLETTENDFNPKRCSNVSF